jgi:hypothetical protein
VIVIWAGVPGFRFSGVVAGAQESPPGQRGPGQ